MKNLKEKFARGFRSALNVTKNLATKAAIVVGGAFALGAAATPSHAAIDTALTGVVTDVSDYFDDIKVVVIAVVVFGIAIAYAKLLKRK